MRQPALTSPRTRLTYALAAVAAIALGLWIHRGGLPLGRDARDITGDAVWAMMMVWWVSAAMPRATLVARAGVALGICFGVELSQLAHTPWLDALRATLVGRLVLGSGFDARDLLAYSLGVLAAACVDAVTRRRRGPTGAD
jgi:di/tricarboxylate transporter